MTRTEPSASCSRHLGARRAAQEVPHADYMVPGDDGSAVDRDDAGALRDARPARPAFPGEPGRRRCPPDPAVSTISPERSWTTFPAGSPPGSKVDRLMRIIEHQDPPPQDPVADVRDRSSRCSHRLFVSISTTSGRSKAAETEPQHTAPARSRCGSARRRRSRRPRPSRADAGDEPLRANDGRRAPAAVSELPVSIGEGTAHRVERSGDLRLPIDQ